MSTSSSMHSGDELCQNGGGNQYEVRFHHSYQGLKIRKDTLSKLRNGHSSKKFKMEVSTKPSTSTKDPEWITDSSIQRVESDIQSLRRAYLAAKRQYVERQKEFDSMQKKLKTLRHRMSSLQCKNGQQHAQLNFKEADEVLCREYQNILDKLMEERARANEDLCIIENTLRVKELELEERYIAHTCPGGSPPTSPDLRMSTDRMVDAIRMLEDSKDHVHMSEKSEVPLKSEIPSSTKSITPQPVLKPEQAGIRTLSAAEDNEKSNCSCSVVEDIWDQLKGKNAFRLTKAQKKRFSIQAQYDANETFRNLLHWNGTVIQFIFWKPITWLCIFSHYAGFFVTRRLRSECTAEFQPTQCWYDRWASQYAVTFQDIPVFMTLAAFLFVSYNNMCLRIFERQYFTCEMVTGRITSLAMHTRSVVKDPARRWGLHRLILASQCVYYWNLRRVAAESHQYFQGEDDHPGSWDDMSSRYFLPENLLTQAECDCISNYRGNRSVLLLAWYERRLRELRASQEGWDTTVLSADSDRRKFVEMMLNHVLEIKGLFSSTTMVGQFGVPFCYYHLTYLVLLMNLAMLAYCFLFINGLKGNAASLIIYPAVVIMLSGLHELANKMSDPFGDDESDLNIDAFLDTAVDESRNLCFNPFPSDGPEDDMALGESACRRWYAAAAAAKPSPALPADQQTNAPAQEPRVAEGPANLNLQVLTQI